MARISLGLQRSLIFREHQIKHNILLACDEQTAQYVQSEDLLYHANWMKPVTTDKFPYDVAEVISIEENEYIALKEAIDSGKEIVIEPEQTVTEESAPTDPVDEITIEYIKTAKINELNNTCNKVITGGFDIILSDENVSHFSLTTQDQLNLITLSALVESGETSIPYHADGELCKFYSPDDIEAIISAATSFKTYHVSYFNALRAYVESLGDIDNISKITYGCEIPDEYQSEVLKVLLAQAGDVDEETT